MLEAPEIPLSQKTSDSPYKDNVLREMGKKNFLGRHPSEQKARNEVASKLRKLRKDPLFKVERKKYFETERARQELEKISIIDPLTGLFNRRYLDAELNREFNKALRSEHDLSSLMIDLDKFKDFNDVHGHPAGDRALRSLAVVLKDQNIIRNTDIPCRYGGEEFFVLLPETNIDGAKVLAERIREAIANISGLERNITASIGIASYHNSPDYRDRIFNTEVTTKGDLLNKADQALYYSKLQGRNIVTAANELTKEQLSEIERLRKIQKGNN